MKRYGLIAFLFGFAAIAYIGSPFVTAWSIREAVRNGNSNYLASAIEWGSVRQTLKPTIARIALNLPETQLTSAAGQTWWTRFKAYWGQGMVDGLVEKYVTPEGLPQLFTLRQTYRSYVANDDDVNKLPLLERIDRAWARVKRAEFTSLTSFEIDMEDKYDPTRLYLWQARAVSSWLEADGTARQIPDDGEQRSSEVHGFELTLPWMAACAVNVCFVSEIGAGLRELELSHFRLGRGGGYDVRRL